jgi:hypothetical protein
MPDQTANQTVPAVRSFDIPTIIVTVCIGILAVCLLWPQVFPNPDQSEQLNLPNLAKRADMLRQTTDPIQRDRMCMGLSYEGRALDHMLQPDARVYLAGMLGPTNVGGLGYYYFLRNYLFPRDLEISLGKVKFMDNAGFYGTDATSADELKSNGFDIVIGFPNNQFQVLPLTPKGVLKQQ